MRPLKLMVLTIMFAIMFVAPGAPLPAAAQVDDRPASPTPIETSYLAITAPFRVQLGALQGQLEAYQRAAGAGQLDTVPQTDLGYLSRELFNARQAFDAVTPSVRLAQYDRTIKLTLDHSYEATVLLLRAQVADSAAHRASLVRQAASFSRRSAIR